MYSPRHRIHPSQCTYCGGKDRLGSLSWIISRYLLSAFLYRIGTVSFPFSPIPLPEARRGQETGQRLRPRKGGRSGICVVWWCSLKIFNNTRGDGYYKIKKGKVKDEVIVKNSNRGRAQCAVWPRQRRFINIRAYGKICFS